MLTKQEVFDTKEIYYPNNEFFQLKRKEFPIASQKLCIHRIQEIRVGLLEFQLIDQKIHAVGRIHRIQ